MQCTCKRDLKREVSFERTHKDLKKEVSFEKTHQEQMCQHAMCVPKRRWALLKEYRPLLRNVGLLRENIGVCVCVCVPNTQRVYHTHILPLQCVMTPQNSCKQALYLSKRAPYSSKSALKFPRKSPIFSQKSPKFFQKGPIFSKSPRFSQKSSTSSPKSPIL